MDENSLAPILEAIVSYIDEGVIIADPSGSVIYQNPSAMELFGMNNEPVTRLREIGNFNLQKAMLRAAIDAGEMGKTCHRAVATVYGQYIVHS